MPPGACDATHAAPCTHTTIAMSTLFANYTRLPFEGQPFPMMRLPPEVRSMIWEYSLPEGRVYEVLDSPNAKQKTPAHLGLMFANVHQEPPPALASVCRESREFVLRRYKPLCLSTTTKYVDLSRDILLLEPYLLVKRLLRTLHFLSQIPLVRDELAKLALGTSYGLHTGICHPVLSWKVSKNSMGKVLARLSKLPKLKKLVFIVHQEFQFEFDFGLPKPMGGLPPAGLGPGFGLGLVAAQGFHRPQLVHQAYRFKFDIESNINYHYPRHPHHNEFLYYPLDIDEDRDDIFDKDNLDEEAEWCDPWPTNDDWRRFRRRFQRAIHLTVEKDKQACAAAVANGGAPGVPKFTVVPALEGASLLWRYTKGGWV